ncbi:zinc finger protein 502 isoform X2 [Osmerus eperlanus]|uniref:zinc finger protein 502 isoform X2 n=2 Tax=Osmerus eperlanus TaxID=29151 RepID=UPI002E0E74AD
MHKRVKSAGPPLPLPSLRLWVSPLRLMYSFVWQVVLQRNVAHYGKVEEFVILVTKTVPDLLSFKQSAQLILGLRARMILEMFRMDQPLNTQTIENLLDKMNICAAMDEVFPNQYGSKYDTALQALIGGLVYRLEQLLPMPDLSQIGSMITRSPFILEECGLSVSDLNPLKILLERQNRQFKGSLTTAISSTVGDCILASLSFRSTSVNLPKQDLKSPLELPRLTESKKPYEASENAKSPATSNAFKHMVMTDDSDYTEVHLQENDGDEEGEIGNQSVMNSGVCDSEEIILQDRRLDNGVAPAKRSVSITGELKQPLKLVPQTTTTETTSQPDLSVYAAKSHLQVSPKVKLVSLQQWVSQIASNTISLPALPPPRQDHATDEQTGDLYLGSNVKSGRPESNVLIERAIIRMRHPKLLGKTLKRKTPKATYTCSDCEKGFPYQSMLADHQRIHTGEKPFKCSECGRTFRTLGFLTNHQKIHTSIRPFKCEECSKCFLKKADLQKHLRVHRGEKPFKCSICEKGFTQASYFKIHMDCHTSDKSFPCTHCDKNFPTAYKLSNHLRWHTDERPYICEQCGRRFHNPSLLKRHMGYHTGDRQYLCAQCGRTFVYMFDLKKHQRDHGPKPQLPCPVCQKVFTSNGSLKVHQRIHTTDKPYRCSICDKGFNQIGNLSVHKKLHSNERPYHCDECGKTYKLSTHLREHKYIHMGKKPCQCATCGKGFRYPGILKKHEQLHLREQAKSPKRYSHTCRRSRHSSKRMLDDY